MSRENENDDDMDGRGLQSVYGMVFPSDIQGTRTVMSVVIATVGDKTPRHDNRRTYPCQCCGDIHCLADRTRLKTLVSVLIGGAW